MSFKPHASSQLWPFGKPWIVVMKVDISLKINVFGVIIWKYEWQKS